MRVADEPAIQADEPEMDSPVAASHTPSFLRALGAILLVFAFGAVPLVWPDLKRGHHFYISILAVVLLMAVLCLAAGARMRKRGAG